MSAHFVVTERGSVVGTAPREVGYMRMSTHFQGAVEHRKPPPPNRFAGSHE